MATEKQIDIIMKFWNERQMSRIEAGQVIDKILEEEPQVCLEGL